MEYLKPNFSRMDLMVEHCMCCVVDSSRFGCIVDGPGGGPSPVTVVIVQ